MTQGASLILYDSLTRAARPFAPIDPDHVRVYSCGPTVYNYAHLGNLRAYVFTDTLSRVLAWKGWQLTHIINITDVGHLTSDADAGDDKMEAAARAQAKSIWDIAAHYTEAFKRNLADLNIRPPSLWSVATDHIIEMVEFATDIAPRHCYELETGLYFDVSTVPDYGRLARTTDDEGESRIDPVAGKRHAQDFAIWRKSAPGENRQMEWDSPWGRGAPGWHLECSVMSRKYLGDQFDIHTGGIDHREIHHPNEIAQNQAHSCTANTGANWWMHNNFLVDRGGKMSKSKGGFTTLQSLIDRGIHPLAYRLMCISAHYRSELEFSAESLVAALTRLRRWVIAVSALADDGGEPDRALLDAFDEAISDDLNLPKALPLLDKAIAQKSRATVARMDEVLGLNLLSLTRADLRVRPADAVLSEDEVEARIAERRQARAAKDFATSDRVRDALAAQGIEIMDGDPLGWDWKIALD
ncbi:cysteine--tRNA ligase [Sphingomonas colocasiae]|uniref:Cysteine--tRNA ligase n=1 Tax=Sphingomonas colocasiae TaxID=1848973 RepID=A0ABS7PPY3_9SPHN|nr:cysteine--tRNA ligase [Sphingomonas colocasiae]MBY8822780.1 cysteine--tRNA ligase [Sphingomonas colocasiae]